MSPWSDEDLARALGELPTPAPPPVEALLARAFPPGASVDRRHLPAFVLATATVAASSLPILLPANEESRAWAEGLSRRGIELSTALIERFGKDRP